MWFAASGAAVWSPVCASRDLRARWVQSPTASFPVRSVLFVREKVPEKGCPARHLLPDSFSGRFTRTVAATGLPSIRLHDLRHTSATLALLAGVPLHVVAARLGQSDPAITLRTYSHLLPSQRDAADRIGSQIYGSWVMTSAERLPAEGQTGHSDASSLILRDVSRPAITGPSA